MLEEAIARYGVNKDGSESSLNPEERQAGLTVNEYETLLMRHDMMHVLHNPLKFVAEKSGTRGRPPVHSSQDLDYAKYDVVRALNKLVDALGLTESVIERAARAMAVPPSVLRFKRPSICWCPTRRLRAAHDRPGTYQSPSSCSGTTPRTRPERSILLCKAH